jgi:hypothetical protein
MGIRRQATTYTSVLFQKGTETHICGLCISAKDHVHLLYRDLYYTSTALNPTKLYTDTKGQAHLRRSHLHSQNDATEPTASRQATNTVMANRRRS